MGRAGNLLEKTYYDTCTIYRAEDVKESYLTEQRLIKKYENIKCALSQGSSRTTGENVAKTTSKHKLFTRPEVDIQKGDEIHVTQQGRAMPVIYTADEPFVYIGCHLEVELGRAAYE